MDPSERPIERPSIKVLLVLCEWATCGEGRPERLMAGPHVWLTTDLLNVPYYQSRGWQVIAVDPNSEEAFHAWREKNPWAA
jgi:hypothetical protein